MRWPVVVLVVVTVLVGLYATATGLFSTPKPPAWLGDRPIAHRGAWTDSAERPENSLEAFSKAADSAQAVELDVHRTKDGALVVIHDADLAGMTGTPGLVEEMSLTQVQQRRLLGGTEVIPTLDEALGRIDGRVPVFVEIKNEGDVGPLEDAVARQLKDYRGEVAVISFNPFSLARVAERAPELPRGQLSGSFEGEDLKWYEVFMLRQLLMNWKSRPDFIAYELKLLPSAVTTVQRWRGRPLVAWTAETPAEAERARQVADAVIANPASLP